MRKNNLSILFYSALVLFLVVGSSRITGSAQQLLQLCWGVTPDGNDQDYVVLGIELNSHV